MPRRHPVLRNAGAVLCLTALASTTACASGPVEVESAALDQAEGAVCDRLVEALPDTLSGQDRREVKPDPAYGAAWGDPPIVLRCGVGLPDAFTELSLCQVVDGVGWFIPDEQIDTGSPEVVMTTVDRTPSIEVRLPADYFPPAVAMVDLAPAVKRSVPQDDPCL